MPNDKSKKQKNGNSQKPEERTGFNIKTLKKPTYAFSLILGLGGIAIALILLLVINDAVDKTEKEIAANLDGAYALFSDIEQTVGSFETEIIALNSTFDDLNGSIGTLAGGMSLTGSTIKSFGSSLSQISFPGFSLSNEGAQLNSAGDDLIKGADDLAEIGELNAHKAALGELKNSVEKIRYDISSQKAQIAQTKQSIADVFGMVKLANFLVFLLFLTLFGIQILNSLAGVM